MATIHCADCEQPLKQEDALCPACGSTNRAVTGQDQILVNDKAAREEMALRIAQRHYQFDPHILEIRTISTAEAGHRPEPNEPVTLLEVNGNTIPVGILPLRFDAVPESGFPYPSVIVEVTPEEFEQIKNEELRLPDGWSLGPVQPKPKRNGVAG